MENDRFFTNFSDFPDFPFFGSGSGIRLVFLPGSGLKTNHSGFGLRKKFRIQPDPAPDSLAPRT